MCTGDNKEKYLEFKGKYADQVIFDNTLDDLLYWANITGMKVNSSDQPQYECGVVIQHYVVSYEENDYSDSFKVTLERKPNKAEEQQLGWERD